MAKASKIVGGTLIGLGALTDIGALSQQPSAQPRPEFTYTNIGDRAIAQSNPPAPASSPTTGLVIGTGMAAAGLWLWNQKTGQGRTRRHASSARRGPRYTGRAR